MDSHLREWLAARRPPIPPAFIPMLLSRTEEKLPPGREGELVEKLTSAALSALRHALAHPGKDRRAAFRLLTGDAFLTYACEAALAQDDPGAAIEGVLRKAGAGLTQ